MNDVWVTLLEEAIIHISESHKIAIDRVRKAKMTLFMTILTESPTEITGIFRTKDGQERNICFRKYPFVSTAQYGVPDINIR